MTTFCFGVYEVNYSMPKSHMSWEGGRGMASERHLVMMKPRMISKVGYGPGMIPKIGSRSGMNDLGSKTPRPFSDVIILSVN
jgi:hypothetical protein